MSKLWIPPNQIFICLWQDESGRYIMNESGEFLCAESRVMGDKQVEENMRAAARYYGVEGGRPVWRRGRRVSDIEHDVQMERLLSGLIPDEQEAAIASIEKEVEDGR